MLGRLFCLIAALQLSSFVFATEVSDTSDAATWDGSVFRIDDTRTRVSLASVQLSVSDLKPEDGNLVGEYTIVVPLMNSKNDHGRIVLPLTSSMNDLGAEGGVLRGQAISYKDGTTPNAIVCEIIPDDGQQVLLDITTDDRTLQFESNYSIVVLNTDS